MPKKQQPVEPAPTSSEPPQRADPTKCSPSQAAAILSAELGQTITIEQIHEDLAAGCPVNADKSLNLIVYASWLLKQEK